MAQSEASAILHSYRGNDILNISAYTLIIVPPTRFQKPFANLGKALGPILTYYPVNADYDAFSYGLWEALSNRTLLIGKGSTYPHTLVYWPLPPV